MIKRKLTSREKIIALICGLMLLIYGVVQVLIRPSKARDQNLLKSIAQKHQDLDRNNQMLKQAPVIDEKYKQYLEIFSQKASEEKETSAMISDMEAIAATLNVQITNMQPQKTMIKEGYHLIGIQIVVSGTLVSITDFVHQLQDAPHYYDVSEAQIEKSMNGDGSIRGRLAFSKIRLKGN